jgi:TPR repeat protein
MIATHYVRKHLILHHDKNRVITWLKKNKDNSYVLDFLGSIYLDGWIVKKDLKLANALFYQSAQLGNSWGQNSLGQNSLGWSYRKEIDVKQDDAEAAKWFSKSAEQGHGMAQNRLAVLYLFGIGVNKELYI